MTTVISRLYAEANAAEAVLQELRKTGFPESTLSVVSEAVVDNIIATRVPSQDAAIYAERMQPENVLVVVRAPVTPFGAARAAMAIVDSTPSLSVGVSNPNYHIREVANPSRFLSVLTDHPRYLTSDLGPDHPRERGFISDGMSWRLLSPHRKGRSGSSGWFTSTKILPFPLLRPKSGGNSAISGGRRWLYNPSRLA
ncbi:MAG: hypothetical protein OXC63_03225 [Aestuariivita sp.]|nr:hypothetical protein [Aestuariivita sp.]MCY4346074.1 hypothetical protein [Aestuariivita sp.]